jgi:hypothetical protein
MGEYIILFNGTELRPVDLAVGVYSPIILDATLTARKRPID